MILECGVLRCSTGPEEKFCNVRSSESAHIAFYDQLTSDSSLSKRSVGKLYVNSEGDRADLEGQKRPPALYACCPDVNWTATSRAALVSIPCPDLRALVLPGSYSANLCLRIAQKVVRLQL